MSEQWKPVPGYEKHYEVSTIGRVRRVSGGRGAVAGRVLTAKRGTRGYHHVDLSVRDSKVRFGIHRLVAMAHIGLAPSLDSVPNHKDGVKTNNSVENLEWVTNADNIRHAFATGLWRSGDVSGEKNGRAKLTASQVAEIRSLKGQIGLRLIARRFGVSKSAIHFIHNGKHWTEDLRVREMPEGLR